MRTLTSEKGHTNNWNSCLLNLLADTSYPLQYQAMFSVPWIGTSLLGTNLNLWLLCLQCILQTSLKESGDGISSSGSSCRLWLLVGLLFVVNPWATDSTAVQSGSISLALRSGPDCPNQQGWTHRIRARKKLL